MDNIKIDSDYIMGIDDPVERLTNAIILQAVKDYINCGCDNESPMGRECYNFFYSQWFETLTNIHPDYIIKICHQLLEENGNINSIFRTGYRRNKG